MPELPEVETARRGLCPLLIHQTVARVQVRNRQLRWPVPTQLERNLPGQTIHAVTRRAKYLLLRTGGGTLLLHLGMSGSLRVIPAETLAEKHDHVDVAFANGLCLRLRDPRRFGAVLWTRNDPSLHPLLRRLGPEPLSADFDERWLYSVSRNRTAAVKTFIMNSHVVAGVGNIYANEALFRSGIHPARPAGRISARRYGSLAQAIKDTLIEAIADGGTTLRDFTDSAGRPGYFSRRLRVYGKLDGTCERCGRGLRHALIGQRSSYYCMSCQR